MTKKELNSKPKNAVKFEDALKRLEKIVERLEAGEVPLEESLSLYEEGISLFRQCSSKLDEAKKKVEILTKKTGSDKLQAEPFHKEKERSVNDAGNDLETDEPEKEELPF